jgi:predicted regulator of Ras-like GTPase activity (Roadblock/LC7/MglB family)
MKGGTHVKLYVIYGQQRKTLEVVQPTMLECLLESRRLFPLSSAITREGAGARKTLQTLWFKLQTRFRSSRVSAPRLARSLQKKAVLMADTPIELREKQYHQIKAVLAKLRLDTAARIAFLVDKDGQQIAVHGDVSNLDTTSLASLTAGNVAATSGMAQLIGEKEFPTLSHEGERESIYISVIGRILLVVLFDEQSSLGLVKLRVKQASSELGAIFDEVIRESSKKHTTETSIFAEITDEDIDSLFN